MFSEKFSGWTSSYSFLQRWRFEVSITNRFGENYNLSEKLRMVRVVRFTLVFLVFNEDLWFCFTRNARDIEMKRDQSVPGNFGGTRLFYKKPSFQPKRKNPETIPYWLKQLHGESTPHHLVLRSGDREHQCYYNPSACF